MEHKKAKNWKPKTEEYDEVEDDDDDDEEEMASEWGRRATS